MSRILFVMLHPGFVRYYEDALHALAEAGHDVHVAFEVSRTKLGEDVTARRLAEASPRITCGTTPERSESVREFLARADRSAVRAGDEDRPWTRRDAWESLATTVRLMADYLRFFEPAFTGADSLRARVEKRLPGVHVALVRVAARSRATRRLLAWALSAIERLVPVDDALVEFLGAQRPDLLLVTPLIELGSQQVDYVKAARSLGIRSALCVASWDNLTSKGLVRVVPDHVVVWNEAQVREAAELHDVPRDRVVVTGAQLFDRWFTMRPTRSREAFCRDVGLDVSKPFLLYVGSSVFIAPDEVPFAERWLDALRSAPDERVATMGALVRPHPANARQWHTLDLASTPNAALWPPIGTGPTSPGFKADYFDSLYHCTGVVGINTSAQIEASIVGRPVLTVRAPEFAHSQQGTLHFRHLVDGGLDGDSNGDLDSGLDSDLDSTGVVQGAASLAEHVRQVRALLDGDEAWSARARRFLRSFVRPAGLDQPVAPIFVEAIGGLAARPRPRPRPDGPWIAVARAAALPLAHLVRSIADGRPLWVYAMRPVVTAGVWAMAVPYAAGDQWDARLRPALKRARRGVWSAWYESTQHVGHVWRRLSKRVARFLRHAGGAAKRSVGIR